MGSLHEHNPSLWVSTADRDGPLPVAGSRRNFDVVVIGAGIFGLTSARLLAGEGCSVAVLDAGPACAGVTGYTTAKVSALQGTSISQIASRLGTEHAAVYAQANTAAVNRVSALVRDDGIDCDFELAPACTYAPTTDEATAVHDEHAAASAAGLSTRLDEHTELPFPVAAAVWLDDQAQFHPRRYCLGLARALTEHDGAVFECVRALDVDEDDTGCVVTTDHGAFTAHHVVVASHLPFMDAGGYFARAYASRSYALAVHVGGARVRGMYLSAGSPTRSVRSTQDGWTILGGEGHKVGQDDNTRQRYETLERWATQHFDVQEIGFRWSAQDYQTVDAMPYVGRLSPGHARVWTATGFRKWGMSNGTAAAMIITDLVSGRDNPWAAAFDSTRLEPGASIKALVKENIDVGKRFVADRVHTWRPRPVDELAPGEGDIAEVDGDAAAAFRDDDGTLHVVAATCTHLGCRVSFNTAERSWDCPCHGSRFDVDGHLLQGPAVEDLAAKDAS